MIINLFKLFLIPENISEDSVKKYYLLLIESSIVFKELYDLETKIEPIVLLIEKRGLWFNNRWMHSEIKRISQKFQLQPSWKSLVLNLEQTKSKKNSTASKELNHIKKWILPFIRNPTLRESCTNLKGNWCLFSSYSGRMTASQMPLTSIPKPMRKYAISSDSHKELWSVDLNQAELRFLAYYANDQFLLDQFNTDQDIYSYIGNLITSFNHNARPERLRNICKTFLLAWLYGASTNTLMKKLKKNGFDITSVDVNHILKQLEITIPQAVHYLDLCSSQNEVQTFFGRVMPLVEMKKSTKRNFALQSSVATAIKLLMLEANKLDLEIVHVIHDELWIEVNPSYSNWQELLQLNFEKTINRYHNGFPLNNILKFNQLKGE